MLIYLFNQYNTKFNLENQGIRIFIKVYGGSLAGVRVFNIGDINNYIGLSFDELKEQIFNMPMITNGTYYDLPLGEINTDGYLNNNRLKIIISLFGRKPYIPIRVQNE